MREPAFLRGQQRGPRMVMMVELEHARGPHQRPVIGGPSRDGDALPVELQRLIDTATNVLRLAAPTFGHGTPLPGFRPF